METQTLDLFDGAMGAMPLASRIVPFTGDAMKTVCFDLETVLLPMDGDALHLFKAKAASMEKSLEEYLAFNPCLMNIICIGYLDEETGEIQGRSTRGKLSEAQLIGAFFKRFGQHERFITWNGRGFDFPVLLNRAAALQIPVPAGIVKAAYDFRFKPNAHVDMMDVACLMGAGRRPSLDSAAVGYYLDSPLGAGDTGSQVADFVNVGDWSRLEDYCQADVRRTHALYTRWMAMVGLPTGGR
jgi:DNA polymerase elongation subunit (family B)